MSPFLRKTCCIGSLLLLSGVAQAADTVVKWPSLKKLDDLAERCEALADKKDTAGLRKIAPEVKKAAALVEADAVPAGAKDAAQVKQLQSDLKSVTDGIVDPDKQDAEDLTVLLAGVHPIVEQLMETAGLPHVHEAPEKKPETKPATSK